MSIDYRLVTCSAAPACFQDLQCAATIMAANLLGYIRGPWGHQFIQTPLSILCTMENHK